MKRKLKIFSAVRKKDRNRNEEKKWKKKKCEKIVKKNLKFNKKYF